MTPNDEPTEPRPANPEAARVSSPWLSDDIFLPGDVGIVPASSTSLMPAAELHERLERLEAESQEAGRRWALTERWIESNRPDIALMLPPGERAWMETQQNTPFDRPDYGELLRSQSRAHQRLLSQRPDFDAVFRAYVLHEAQQRVREAQGLHLEEQDRIARTRSDLTEPALEPQFTDLFTSLERAAAAVNGWSRSIRPDDAELADSFQAVASTLEQAAGKKDLIRSGRLEMLENHQRFAASESFINQRLAIVEAHVSDRKFLQLLAAEAREITPSLESRLKQVDGILRNQVRAGEEFLVHAWRSANPSRYLKEAIENERARGTWTQGGFLDLQNTADEIKALASENPNSREVRDPTGRIFGRMRELASEALHQAREYELVRQDAIERFQEYRSSVRLPKVMAKVLAKAWTQQRARIERDREELSRVLPELERTLTPVELSDWRARLLAAQAFREGEMAHKTALDVASLRYDLRQPGLQPRVLHDNFLNIDIPQPRFRGRVQQHFALLTDLPDPKEVALFRKGDRSTQAALARVGTPDPDRPGEFFEPPDAVAVREYWKSIYSVHRLTQTAEQLGLGVRGIDVALFDQRTPPRTDGIRSQMESLKQAVRSFQTELERRSSYQYGPGETPQDPDAAPRIRFLKARIAPEQARATLEHFTLAERILRHVSENHRQNAIELAAVLGGTAQDMTGAQRQPAQNSRSLAEGYSEGEQQIQSQDSQRLLTMASDVNRIESLLARPGNVEIAEVRGALSTLEDNLNAIREQNELRQWAEQIRSPIAASEISARPGDASSVEVRGALNTVGARREAAAVAAREPSSLESGEAAPGHGVEPAGERGTHLGHTKAFLGAHGADVAFGGLAVLQAADAYMKGDAKGFKGYLGNVALLGGAAFAPTLVQLGASARGASEALAGKLKAGTAFGLGGTFTLLSTIATVESWNAYRQANQEGEKKEALYATVSNGVDATAGFAATLGSALSALRYAAARPVGYTAMGLTALSFGAHAVAWYKGPKATQAAGDALLKGVEEAQAASEWLLEKAGISSKATAGIVDSGPSVSPQTLAGQVAEWERRREREDLGLRRVSQTQSVSV